MIARLPLLEDNSDLQCNMSVDAGEISQGWRKGDVRKINVILENKDTIDETGKERRILSKMKGDLLESERHYGEEFDTNRIY